MNESHFDHPEIILRGFLKAGEYASAFLQPTDQPFDNVTFTIGFAIKFYCSVFSIFVVFRRDHRVNIKIHEVTIDPICPVALIACKLQREGNGIVLINNIHCFEERRQGLIVMRLSRRQMHAQGMAMTIAENVDLC